MWKYLLHLWAKPPLDLPLTCPAPAAGQPPDLSGAFDPDSVVAAFQNVSIVSALIVLLLVLACYQMTRSSLGRTFVIRWWVFVGFAAGLCALAAFALLTLAPTRALEGSCDTNPTAFVAALPGSIVLARSIAGLVWAFPAFAIMSLILTQTAGRFPSLRNGFFHNRGCPWPRFLP
jgi:hypothetical protein